MDAPRTFDPHTALPGAPDPWAGSDMPPIRSGPPYLMTEMIAAEPALAARIAARIAGQQALAELAEAIRTGARDGAPITVTGCGTSQHAAMAIAALLTDALAATGAPGPVGAIQAFELSRRVPPGGVVIAVSHEGGTEATNGALEAARGLADRTALITVGDRSPGAALADLVLSTGEQDQSWCHTVGYLSPIVVGACLHGALTGLPPDPAALQRAAARGGQPGCRRARGRGICERHAIRDRGLGGGLRGRPGAGTQDRGRERTCPRWPMSWKHSATVTLRRPTSTAGSSCS